MGRIRRLRISGRSGSSAKSQTARNGQEMERKHGQNSKSLDFFLVFL
jgi:hypothetical protein